MNYLRNFLIDTELKNHWHDKGYVIIRNAVAESLIDELNTDIDVFRKNCGETKDEYGFGQRIGLFHIQNRKSLGVALNQKVQNFLRWAFNDEPLLYGSLTFETGTEQSAHIDSIFFFTQPIHTMAGCWTALEDINEEAGPLFYIESSHKFPLLRGKDVISQYPELKEKLNQAKNSGKSINDLTCLAQEVGNRWNEMLAERIDSQALKKVPVTIQKGDILIWHSLLIHGGSPRINRSLSRKSMVTHFIGRNTLMYDMNQFFLLDNNEFTKNNRMRMEIVNSGQGFYVKHSQVVTY